MNTKKALLNRFCTMAARAGYGAAKKAEKKQKLSRRIDLEEDEGEDVEYGDYSPNDADADTQQRDSSLLLKVKREKQMLGRPKGSSKVEASPANKVAPTKRAVSGEDGLDAKRRNSTRKFALYVDAQGAWTWDPVDSRISIEAEMVTEKDVERAGQLAPDEVRSLVTKMVRYLLFRGSKRLPIIRSKLNEAVMGQYKSTKLLNFVLGEAQKLLRASWGYDLVPVPPKDARHTAFAGQLADSWYVVISKELRSVDHSELVAMDLDDQQARERAFLMVCFSTIVANGGSVSERELFRSLNAVDPNIDDRAFLEKKTGRIIPGLGANVLDLLDKAAKEHHYLVKTIENDQISYALGPRALVEVGRFQIIQFQADAIGESVDATIISELQDHACANDNENDENVCDNRPRQ